MTNTIFAVHHKYIQNLNDVYEHNAKPIYSDPELSYTCECKDLYEVLAFNRFLEGEACDPGLDLEVEQVTFRAAMHYDRDAVKLQMMRTFATIADISGIEKARHYGPTDLVSAALSED